MLCIVLLVIGLVYHSEADIQLSGSAMISKRVKTLTFSSDVNLMRFPGRMVAYHQWNHVYIDNTDQFITKLGALKAEKSKFTIDLEKFDNNTEVYNLFEVYNASNGDQLVLNLTLYGSGMERRFIHLVDDGYYEYRKDVMLKLEYSVTKQVSFSCREYTNLHNVQIGWINTVGNKIFLYKEAETNLTLSADHNGSMLCCIYYFRSLNKNEMNIQRFVKNKTLLIHREEMFDKKEPSDSTTENYCERSNGPETSHVSEKSNERNCNTTKEMDKNSNTAKEISNNSNPTNKLDKNSNVTKETDKNANATNETDKKSNVTKETDKNTYATNEIDKKSNVTKETDKNIDATNETDTNSKTTNITNTDRDQDVVTSNNFPIVVSAISVSVVILLVMIFVIYKRCRRQVDRPDRSQRPLPPIPRQRTSSELDPNSPFYLNLLFRRECRLEIQAREEPQYEEAMYH